MYVSSVASVTIVTDSHQFLSFSLTHSGWALDYLVLERFKVNQVLLHILFLIFDRFLSNLTCLSTNHKGDPDGRGRQRSGGRHHSSGISVFTYSCVTRKLQLFELH